MEIIKVSSKSNPVKLAGAISNIFKEHNKVELISVGAAAINQSIKGIAIARGILTPLGYNLVTIPTFLNIEIDNKERTAIKLTIINNS